MGGNDPRTIARHLQLAQQHRIEAGKLSESTEPTAKAHGAQLDELADVNDNQALGRG